MTIQTAWIAAPLMLLIAFLGVRISLLRLGGKARSQDQQVLDRFNRWQRAHGNAIEHVPLMLFLLLLLELLHGGRTLVLGIGATIVVSRLLHAVGYIVPVRRAKVLGSGLTYAVELLLGVLVLVKMVQTL